MESIEHIYGFKVMDIPPILVSITKNDSDEYYLVNFKERFYDIYDVFRIHNDDKTENDKFYIFKILNKKDSIFLCKRLSYNINLKSEHITYFASHYINKNETIKNTKS